MTGRTSGTALIAGGSIGGLFAAAALLRRGWQVRVFERTGVELAGRGAGIVTHAPLIAALDKVGASVEDLGVAVSARLVFDRAGRVVRRLPYPQIVTSWDRIHQTLRALMPEGAYQTGCHVAGFEDTGDSVTAVMDDGRRVEADVLIGADGFRSAVRGQMLPEVRPAYAGYVVWRTVADEAALPDEIRKEIFPEFALFVPNGMQVVGYPIAGPENDLREGHRRYNFVWYSAVSEEALSDMLIDADGRRHAMSIPPPLVRDAVLAGMMAEAERCLPRGFAEILRLAERPFFTPIYDHCSPRFAMGRVALAGDAASVARPHVGMGVTKAAEDALSLADRLHDLPVEEALRAYCRVRVPAARRAHDRARRLGGYIFETQSARNSDGSAHPMIDTILAETAVPVV